MKATGHIMFAGGGTGGHLFPGLAVAEALRRCETGWRSSFCGVGRELERKGVRECGFDYSVLPAAPLVASAVGVIRAFLTNSMGYRAARQLVREQRPDVVVGLGGYSSIPLGLAAVRERVPLVLLEQNVMPGRANRLLARWASVICLSFAESAEYLPLQPRIVTTGNPVREAILKRALVRAEQADQREDPEPHLLILGGSQGAHSLNQFVIEALPKIETSLSNWRIIHQAGIRDEEWVREAYSARQLPATVSAFIDDMAAVYSRTTLAIARAGATSLAEFAVAGIPAVLFPYPFATANHQWHNAQAFGRRGAAIVVDDRPEPGRSKNMLISALLPLLRLPELRREMRMSMHQMARADATEAVMQEILQVARDDALVRQSA